MANLKAQYAIIGEHVRDGANGTFDILGVFDRVFAPAVPARHQRLVFVVQLVTTTEDGLGKQPFRMTVYRPNGKKHAEVSGQINVKAEGGTWLGTARINVNMDGIPLPEYGKYRFVVEVNGEEIADHPLTVVQPK